MGMFFYTLSTFWGGIFVAFKKTKSVGITTVVAAVLHLVLTVALIKPCLLYTSGVELCAVYTIADGKISLSCLNDKYVCDDPIASTLCNVVLTPSKHYEMCIRDRSRSHPSTTPTWKWASSTWCCSNAAWPGWTRVPPRACCRRRNSSRPFRNGRVSTRCV